MSSYKKSFDMFPQKQQQQQQQQQKQQQISNGKISRWDTLGEYRFNIFILFFLPFFLSFFLSFFLTFFFFDFNISFVKFHRKGDGRISQYGSIRNFL